MASIQYVVSATDAASAVFAKIGLSADHLDSQLQDLSKRVATPEIDLKDAKFTAGLIRAAERIDKLSEMVADPAVEVDTRKAQTEILRITAMLDRLDAKRVNVSVDVDRSLLSRVGGGVGGLGGLLGGAGGAIGGGVSSLGQYGQGALYGLLGGLAAVLAPALLPLGLGGLAGGGAALGAYALGKSAAKQLAALNKQLASPSLKGPQRADIRAQVKALQQASGPELAISGVFQDLGMTAKDVFAGALKGQQGIPGVHFLQGLLAPLGAHGLGGASSPAGGLVPGLRGALQGPLGTPVPFQPSFLAGLTGILKQVAGFIKSIGPQLADLFRASIPFLQMFVKFLEQAAKALLPAFVQMLHEMTPFLPVISKGLMDIVKGFVGFLNAIGPSGMKASARIFVVLAEGMAAVMVALGHTINWLAENIPTWIRKIHNEFDVLRHETAVIFDGIRHEIAHVWDQIFQNTIGTVIRFVHNVETQFNSVRHETAVIFDGVRHEIAHVWDQIFSNTIGVVIRLVHNVETQYDSLRHGIATAFDTIRHGIATAWDTIWTNTVTRVKNGIGDVVSWFKGLPGKAVNALEGLGTSLYNFAHMAMTKLWNGLKNVFSSVWDWFKSLPGKLLHAIGINSPPDWAIQAGKHIMGGILHGITSRKTELQNAFASATHGAVSGALGGDALANQALAKRIFPWGADQWMPFVSLVMAESGFNRFAKNPSSGAYGIAQALPPTKYPFAGQEAGGSHAGPQLSWMFNYIAQRYGTPAQAWAHELSAHWYGGGLTGGIFNRPTLIGVGERGPERVDITPAGSRGGGGNTYNINVTAGVGSNPKEIGRQIVGYIRSFEQGSGAGWRR